MNTNKFTRFDHNRPCRCIANRKNSRLRFDTSDLDIFLEAIGYLLWNESDFGFSSAFSVRQNELAAFTFFWAEIQYLSNSHSTARHQLQHQPVPGVICSKDDFINDVFLDHRPMFGALASEGFFESR